MVFIAISIGMVVTGQDRTVFGDSGKISVAVPPNFTVATTNTPVKCFGAHTGTATATYTGAPPAPTFTYSWNTTPAQTTSIATNLAAGTYTVTVTESHTGTVVTAIATITQPASLPAVTASMSHVACGLNPATSTGGSVTAIASGGTPGYTYFWTPGGETSATATNLTSGTYTVAIRDANLCSTTATTSVTLTALPATPTVGSNGPICAGSTLSLTARSTGATGYAWSGPNGFTSSNQNPSITNTTIAASGTYTVIATNGSCTSSATVAVTVNPIPVNPVVSSNSPVCTGATLNLTASSSGAISYSWTGPNGFTSSAQNPSRTGMLAADAGTYTVVARSVSGCTSSSTTTVVINTAPAAPTVSSNSPICAGASLTITVTSPLGATNYHWTGPNYNATTTAPSITLNGSGQTGTYSVTATEGTCTSLPATVAVVVTPLPTVNITSVQCPTPPATLCGTGATTYLWNTGATTACVTVTPTTTTMYTVTGTTNGCSSTAEQQVSVLNVTPSSATICSGGSVTLSANGEPNYEWSIGSTASSITVSPTTTTTYTVIGGQRDGTFQGCTVTKTITVTVVPIPTITVTSATICSGSSATLTASGVSVYSWSTGATTSSISVNPTVTTTYTINGNTSGCSAAQKTTVVTVTAAPAKPTVSSNSPICAGASLTMTVTSPLGATNYHWTGPNYNATTTTPTVILNGTGQTGTYSVTATEGTCTSLTTTVAVVVNPIPTVSITTTQCPTPPATLCATGATTYLWNTSATTACITVTPTTSTEYTVTGTTNGCSSTALQRVGVLNVAPSSATICAGGSVTLSASGEPNYQWSTGSTASSITVNPTATTTYTVIGGRRDGGFVGCTITKTITVTVVPTPTITVTSAAICSGNTATLTASGVTTYSWSNGATTSSITVSPAVTTTYTVNGNTSGCSAVQKTTVVTVNPIPGAPAVSSNSPICSGSTLTLTASAAGAVNYSWTGPNGFTSVAQNPFRTGMTVADAGTYTVTVKSPFGCTNSSTIAVVVNAVPTTPVVISNSPICEGEALTLTVTSPLGATSYHWTGPNYNATTTSSSITLNGTGQTGNYFVTATEGTCTSLPVAISVVVKPVPVINAHAATPCQTSPALLCGTGATTYVWSTGATTACVTVSPTVSTVYTVTGTTNGCSAQAVIGVPVLNVTPTSTTICAGSSITLSASGELDYRWSTGATTSSITVSPATTTTYTVIGGRTDGGGFIGCTLTKTITVTVLPIPTITVTSATICSGNSATLTASGVTTYSWSTGATTSSITVSPATTTTYTVNGSTSGCSAAQKATVVTVIPTPTVTVSATSTSICANSSATLTAGGASVYLWSTGATTSSINVNPASTTTYTVTGSVATPLGTCSSVPQTITINVISTPTITVTAATICSGNTATLTASGASVYLWNTGATTSSIAITPTTTTTYIVNGSTSGCPAAEQTGVVTVNPTPTVTITSNNVNCYSGNSGSATANSSGGSEPYTFVWSNGQTSSAATNLGAGTYSVTVTDAHGCIAKANTSISQPSSALSVSIPSSTNISCQGANGSATASVVGGTAPYTYSWLPNGGTGNIASNLAAGNYTVTVTDANNCIASTTVSITQMSSSLSAQVEVTSGCSAGSGTATATASGGTTPYLYSWSPSGGTGATASNLNAGTYTVTVTDANGCTVTAIAPINIYGIPTVTVTPSSATISAGQNVSLTANGNGGTPPYSYSWQPATGLNSTSTGTVLATPTVTTTYTVTINDANGICTSNATATVNVTSVTSPQTPTSCDTCIGGLNLQPGKTYLASVWAKNNVANPTDTTYLNPELKLVFNTSSSGTVTLGPFFAQGRIIDGWQRIEAQFTVPVTATDFNIQLACASGQCNFDDIRIFPFNGTLKTYVYDPNTLRLMAVLDERNYATIYEYDEEGKLIRVKKETERGIMTIQESRTSMQKKQ